MESPPGDLRGTSCGPDPRQGDRAGKVRSPFKCNVCQRTYARIDHLSRHFRLHTSERPYRCEVCLKAFNRPDLLKRHALGHENNNRTHNNRPSRARRVTQACKACAVAKLKCKEEKPCHRCVHKHIACEYNEVDPSSSEWQLLQSSVTAAPNIESCQPAEALSSYSGEGPLPNEELVISPSQAVNDPTPCEIPLNNGHRHDPTTTPDCVVEDGRVTLSTEGPPIEEENIFADFLRDIMMHAELEPPGSQLQQTSETDIPSGPLRDLLSFGLESNLEFGDDDYMAVDFHVANNFGQLPHTHEAAGDGKRCEVATPQPCTPIQSNENHLELGIKAFRSSLWCWTPARADTGSIEQQHLALQPLEVNNHTTGMAQDFSTSADRLTSGDRDKILALVLSTTARSSFAKVISNFPSVDFLDNLMHLFLTRHARQSDTWIHIATFKAEIQRAELLGSIISAGAALSTSSPVRKLGFAVHEAVRQALPRVCEENNSVTRDLALLQAMVLNLETGLWSGNKRKIELAESHAGVVTTMCRRAGRFLRSSYKVIAPSEDDEGDILDDKWKRWAYQESLKRLVFVLFTRDAQTSISFVVPTIISYAELSLPLPESRDLFLARSPGEWKSIYLSQASLACSHERMPSLQQYLNDPNPLSSPFFNYRIDIQLSLFIIAYGIWRQIFEYRQLNSVIKANPPPHLSHSILVLEHRHRELCQTLQIFSVSHSNLELKTKVVPIPDLQLKLLVELLLTHLHVSFENIQLFAGREGEEEARRVYPSLKLWATSREARTAVFRAGQIIRYAKLITSMGVGSHSGLRDFFAVAVYHAALTFWAFGILNLKPGYNEDMQQPPISYEKAAVEEYEGSREEMIWLDIEENATTNLFLTLSRGIPCFSTVTDTAVDRIAAKDSITLRDPQKVMAAVAKILRGTCNRNGEDILPPPLVDNLSQLIMGLGEAAKVVYNSSVSSLY